LEYCNLLGEDVNETLKVVEDVDTTDFIPFKELLYKILPLGSITFKVSLIISFLTGLLDNSFIGTKL